MIVYVTNKAHLSLIWIVLFVVSREKSINDKSPIICLYWLLYTGHQGIIQTLLNNLLIFYQSQIKIKSNQIKSLLLSHHHSTSASVSEILMSVLQTVQKTTIYIRTVHIYRLYRRQCAKYTYIYSVHIVYYKHILYYQLHIIHRMGASTLCTLSIHYVVYT